MAGLLDNSAIYKYMVNLFYVTMIEL